MNMRENQSFSYGFAKGLPALLPLYGNGLATLLAVVAMT